MTRSAWLLFATLSIVWGVPYFFIKIALRDLTPEWIAFSRVALGAMILAPFVSRAGWLALRSSIPAVAVVALTDIAVPFYLIANGERFVSSSLTGLLLAAIPIAVALFALVLDPHERLRRSQVAGLAIGVLGVATLLGFDGGRDRNVLLGAALVSGAAISYAIGVLLIRRWLKHLPLLASSAAMLALAALMLAPAALLHPPPAAPNAATFGAIVVLGAVCTAAAYVMYFALIARAGATRASVVTYINPAVSVLLGVFVLREPLGPTAIAGLVLVIAGSWLSAGGNAAALAARPQRRAP